MTLSALGASALAEAIKFLYEQAAETVKRRRESDTVTRRRKWEEAVEERGTGESEAMSLRAPGIVEGELAPAVIDFEAVEFLQEDLKVFSRHLANYVSGIEEVEPSDEGLLRAADALRRILEAIYQQRITFKGEERPPSGPLVGAGVDVEEVAGYAAGLRTEAARSGRVRGEADAKPVQPGGEVIGIDVKRFGDPDAW